MKMISAATLFPGKIRRDLILSHYLLLWGLLILFSSPFLSSGKEKTQKKNCIRIDFTASFKKGKGISGGWHYKGKPFTRDIDFSIVELDGVKVLKVAGKKSSGTILYDLSTVDLKKYPLLRWKWMAERLPENACGTDAKRDDQVLAVYAGAGRPRTNSVAFRWETNTQKGRRGLARYGLGMVLVNWIAVRNKQDALNTWYIEEVNLLKHLQRLFPGGIPKKDLALSITGNSQYTGSDSIGYIEYLEFHPATEKGKYAHKKR